MVQVIRPGRRRSCTAPTSRSTSQTCSGEASTISYETTDAVACADLYALAIPGTKDVNIYAIAEGYCQGSDSTLPQCTAVGDYYYYEIDHAINLGQPPFTGICGVHTAYGSCNSGSRNYFYTKIATLDNDDDCHTFMAGLVPEDDIVNGPYTQIELPGDAWRTLYSQLTTPDVSVCDNM
jgi:hypothetical protein